MKLEDELDGIWGGHVVAIALLKFAQKSKDEQEAIKSMALEVLKDHKALNEGQPGCVSAMLRHTEAMFDQL